MSGSALHHAHMPAPVVVAGMELVDGSLMVWPGGEYIRQVYRWPVTTPDGRLALCFAWAPLRQHHGSILSERRKYDRSVKA